MSEKREINFHYVFPEDYNPVYCTGAYGGISPQGDIVANFYLERMPIPKSITHELNDDGSLGEIVQTDPSDLRKKVVRYVSAGIILNEANARSICDWLNQQLDELEARRQVLQASVGVDENGHEQQV